MNNKMLLTTKLDQRLVMNQQLSQAITLLQYNTIELKQLVQQYIDSNPLIEQESIDMQETNDSDENETIKSDSSTNLEDIANLHLYSADINQSSKYAGDESILENIASPKTLRYHLLDQLPLCGLNSFEQLIAESIIDAINDDGRIAITKEEICQACNVSINNSAVFDGVLHKLQQLDPLGVAAFTLQECLLIQIRHSQHPDHEKQIALTIIQDYFELLADNKLKTLQAKLKIESSDFSSALQLIKSLDPKPGLKFTSDVGMHIEPELVVKKIRNQWKVFLSESILTKIKINKEYQHIIKEHKSHQAYAALSKELQEAQWLIKGLQRRNETLLNTASQIIKYQVAFLEHGKTFMKPLTIADISTEIGVHESTVSRVTTGKYIATPFGVFELKFFFPSYVLTDTGHSCSEVAVKEHIKEIIQNETAIHIYSDSEIVNLLKDKGIKIARRTVAKYREALKILPSYQRAQQLNSNN